MKTLTEQYYSVTNTRAIKVKFMPPTTHKGARVKITDDYLAERKQSIVLSYDYEIADVAKQAFKFLTDKGFDVVCRASDENQYLFMVNNWSENYLTLKG